MVSFSNVDAGLAKQENTTWTWICRCIDFLCQNSILPEAHSPTSLQRIRTSATFVYFSSSQIQKNVTARHHLHLISEGNEVISCHITHVYTAVSLTQIMLSNLPSLSAKCVFFPDSRCIISNLLIYYLPVWCSVFALIQTMVIRHNKREFWCSSCATLSSLPSFLCFFLCFALLKAPTSCPLWHYLADTHY